MLRALLPLLVLILSAAAARAEPALWRVQDADTTIYMFGTIHALPEDLDWRGDTVDTAFAEADLLCVETDVVAAAEELLGLMLAEGVFTDGRRLSDFLDEEQEADLRELSKKLRVPYSALDVMKPWNVLMTLSSAFANYAGLSDLAGVESVLIAEANARNLPICDMETPREHIMSIAGLPIDVQVAALTYEDERAEEIDDLDTLLALELKAFDKMVTAWSTGRPLALVDDKETFGHPDFYDAILTKRNRAWVEGIEDMLERHEGTVFIAVGAAHLVGPDSVQTMLEAKGIKVDGPAWDLKMPSAPAIVLD